MDLHWNGLVALVDELLPMASSNWTLHAAHFARLKTSPEDEANRQKTPPSLALVAALEAFLVNYCW